MRKSNYQIYPKYFKTHGKRGEGLKEIDNDIYSKLPNSWIHNTSFKPL